MFDLRHRSSSARSGNFLSREDGSMSIEAALWMPIFAGMLLMITNASMVFNGRSEAMRIVQDGNRAFSVGRLVDEQETEDFITERLARLTAAPVVNTVLQDGIIYTDVKIPVEDLARIGSLGMFSNYDVSISSQIFLEF